MRHISLSTCGVVDKIYDLANRKLQLTLSVSLHAPNDRLREQTMPINRKWGVEELLKACRYYTQQTGRRISFEYAMIQHVNDSDACAQELAGRLRGMLCHVNLIPVNDVTGNSYKKVRRDAFRNLLIFWGTGHYRYGAPDTGLGYRCLVRAASSQGRI